MKDFDWLTRHSLKLAELESQPLSIGRPSVKRSSQETMRAILMRRRRESVRRVAMLIMAIFTGPATFWYLQTHYAGSAVVAARREANLQAAVTADALAGSEVVRTVDKQEIPVLSLPMTAYVYVGRCGDGDSGWLTVNFSDLPRCYKGDIMVTNVRGRKVRALHNLTLRNQLPTEHGLGESLKSYLPAETVVKIIEMYPMSKIADPPRLYWAKIELSK